jgi:VanZ family protein
MAIALRRAPAPLALMALVFFLSAQPDLDTGLGVWDTVARKLGHAAVYCGLCLLWIWTLSPRSRRPALFAATISLLYAISDEWHQSFIEGRHGSALDVGIDLGGIVLAATLALGHPRVRQALGLSRAAATRTG